MTPRRGGSTTDRHQVVQTNRSREPPNASTCVIFLQARPPNDRGIQLGVTPGTLVQDPGPPVFVPQSQPLPYNGHLAVEGGHGTGAAEGPAFDLPTSANRRIGVFISQREGPTSVWLIHESGPSTRLLLGTCAMSCTDQLVIYPGKVSPGTYRVMVESPSDKQWEFVIVID